MQTHLLERAQVIERPRAETFAFFGDAFNLERITPAFLRFRILNEPPIEMGEGTLLEYRLALFGIRFYWKTLIERWSPEESFVDVQLKGPYALWRHTHTFEELSRTSTLVRDRVEYQIPYGLFGRIAHGLFVKRALKKIFDHRAQVIARLLAPAGQSVEYEAGTETRSLHG
jgi:ligand-binding SRPBCC domain-containing protein